MLCLQIMQSLIFLTRFWSYPHPEAIINEDKPVSSLFNKQQSSSLTARMHHNSQKRINTSKLFCDLTLTQHSPIHPSPLLQQLCVHDTADSAVQETPPPFPDVCHFLTSLFTSAAHGALASTTVEILPPSLTHPPHVRSAAPHKRLSDYKYPAVSSMKMKLTGWVSLKCVMGSACVCAQE